MRRDGDVTHCCVEMRTRTWIIITTLTLTSQWIHMTVASPVKPHLRPVYDERYSPDSEIEEFMRSHFADPHQPQSLDLEYPQLSHFSPVRMLPQNPSPGLHTGGSDGLPYYEDTAMVDSEKYRDIKPIKPFKPLSKVHHGPAKLSEEIISPHFSDEAEHITVTERSRVKVETRSGDQMRTSQMRARSGDETRTNQVASLVAGHDDDDSVRSSPESSIADVYLLAVIAGCALAAVSGLALTGVCWYRLHKRVKAASDVEYPAYGVTGPAKDKGGAPPGDRKLAQSAQMYHYQHQKQQMIASERVEQGGGSEGETEDEGEEGDYTVFECPGLATAGEMEVRNPLFNDQTPVAPPAEK